MCKSTNTQTNQEENIIIGCCLLLIVESQISHAYSRSTKFQQYIKNICRNKRAMKKSDFDLWVLLGKRLIWYRAENLTFSGFFFLNLQKEVLSVWHSPSTYGPWYEIPWGHTEQVCRLSHGNRHQNREQKRKILLAEEI